MKASTNKSFYSQSELRSCIKKPLCSLVALIQLPILLYPLPNIFDMYSDLT